MTCRGTRAPHSVTGMVYASGDLDRDGTTTTLTMDCTLTNGVVTCTLILPDVLD